MNSERSFSPTVPGETFAGETFAAEPAPPPYHGAPREALLRRIDEELAQLGDIEISSWMVGLQSEATTGEANGEATAVPASEIEVDIALAATLMQTRGGQQAHACVHLVAKDGVLVAGRHVRLMQLLQQRDHRFEELHALTGLSEGQLLRDLAALRMVGSIKPV